MLANCFGLHEILKLA